jgi:hypothetical protein
VNRSHRLPQAHLAGVAVIAMAVPATGSSSGSPGSGSGANSKLTASAPGIKLTSLGVGYSDSAGETVRVRLEPVTAVLHAGGEGFCKGQV